MIQHDNVNLKSIRRR